MLTVKQLWLTIITIATNLQQTSGCPLQCLCQETNYTMHVNCANRSLGFIPANIPTTVTILDLHGNRLSSLADVFQNLTRLEKLDLSFNQLSAFQSQHFHQSSRLEYLNLESNNISHLEADTFQYLPKMKTLNLANNSIRELNGAIFHGLLDLEDLLLQGNEISNVSADVFTQINPTVHLDLSENAIRDLPKNIFSHLLDLQELNLRYNFLTTFNGQFLFGNNTTLRTLDLSFNNVYKLCNLTITNLTAFDLSWNNITNISESNFDHLENLSSLVLDGNPVSKIKTAVFENLKNLRNLSLSHMPKLSYLSKTTFQGLDMLEVLNLCNNPHLSFIHKQLFVPLLSVSIVDLSGNSISYLYNETLFENSQLSSLNLVGNNFTCDCAIEWLILSSQTNNSIIVNSDQLECVQPNSGEVRTLLDVDVELLHCSDVRIVNHSADSAFRIGKPVILQCEATSNPAPEITWITPRKHVLTYHNFHEYATSDYLNTEDEGLLMDLNNEDRSYYSESEARPDRIQVLADGSLYIAFIMRSDGGPYKCVAENPKNTTEVVINVTLDYSILTVVKIWSFVVGFACAGGFFLLNLTYSLTLAAVRRCVSQRRRERIRAILESMDQYKTAHLGRIKENYHNQVGRIRDQYHYQLGRLREHHQNQTGRMGRMREGASQKVEKLRDNYNNQLGRLKDYSSNQLLQLREKYNSQVDKMKDYGSDKLDRIHEKYKLKQQHVIKLLEMMNLDNCRTVFESECVRTESMILHSDMFPSDVPLHTPSGSISPSDSEYVTASSSESSKYSSQENIYLPGALENEASYSDNITPMNPYLPEDDDNDVDENHQGEIKPCNILNNGNVKDSISSKPMKDDSKHSKGKRKHRKKRNSNFDETETLYKEYCDTQNNSNESKEYDTNEAKECEEPKENCLQGPVWHTSANTVYGAHGNHILENGSTHSVNLDSDPGPSGFRTHRKRKKHSKSSKTDHHRPEGSHRPESHAGCDEVSVDISDEFISDELPSWTIKESVV